ncbi:MarR family transcriptional regulator [Streptomyces albiaxialis]|uniref:MarR family transcriptional regulator n=1 Tax=Streptomyces albiaxialis TaxID=329523 RepID=A0ABP5HG52_9ACTN
MLNDTAPSVPSAPAGDEEDDRWCMAVRLLGQVEKQLDTTLQRHHGLPLSEYRALCALSRAEGAEAMRMGELADRIGLKDSTVTRLVARLESQGLAARTSGSGSSTRDGRTVTAVITESGRKRYEQATPTYRAALGRALDTGRANIYLADLATWVRTGRPASADTDTDTDTDFAPERT